MTDFLDVLLILIPWSAVNLADYFCRAGMLDTHLSRAGLLDR